MKQNERVKVLTEIPADSYDSLVKKIGGKEALIKQVIEECFFFSIDIVKDQFNYIKNHLNVLESHLNHNPKEFSSNQKFEEILIARKSTLKYKNKKYTGDIELDNKKVKVIGIEDTIEKKRKNLYCIVEHDKDGNYETRRLIKEKTGIILQNEKRNLKNFIISHIWRNPHDPRYFTNFWNIVLVPSYANSLLDKIYDKASNHIGYYLLETLKYTITKLYNFKDLDWQSIFMTAPSYNQRKIINTEIIDNIKVNVLCGDNLESDILIRKYKMQDYNQYHDNTNYYNFFKLQKINDMEDFEIEKEIEKVERRVFLWKRKKDQINSRILSLFMKLSDNGENGVFLDMLRDEFDTLYPEESNIFDTNYNQMKNFGSHNHAKVFEEDEEYTVRLWYPVRDIIRELYSY